MRVIPKATVKSASRFLRDALRRKNAYADKTGSKVYVVTQFTFTADSVTNWETSHSADIGQLPVTVGLPGLASAKTLLKYAMDCGVGASLAGILQARCKLDEASYRECTRRHPRRIGRSQRQDTGQPLAGVHFFPFGGFKKTADWANKVVAGNFEIHQRWRAEGRVIA